MQKSKSSLIVVSNRLPISVYPQNGHLEIKTSTGGLASALIGVQTKIDFTWVGWPGASFLDPQRQEIEEKLIPTGLVPVYLSREQEEYYYHVFCNSILWPLFHYFTDRITHSFESWKYYEEVNALFAEKVIEHAAFGATVWVHDFHLMLLPLLLKEKRADLNIGFFLHIPFPSSEIYRMFPKREVLLKGLLSADYLGFHTSDYARHFRLACSRVLGADSDVKGVTFQEKKTGVGVHPIGMNIDSFAEVFTRQDSAAKINEIKSRYQGQKVILGVERLDYSKGISLKLEAFELFLENNPEQIGKVVLLQIIVPSRHESLEYQRYRSNIEKAISRLNGRFSKPGFSPIQYIYRNLPVDELVSLFCLADVCLVASLRDGMNLVAQEFIYCTSHMPEAGVLLLSEFAGAAHHLPHATLINPLDIEGMAKDIEMALKMPVVEKNLKALKMKPLIEKLDSPLWAAEFLEKLEQNAQLNHPSKQKLVLNPNERKNLIARMTQSQKQILFLDYDGTLQDIASLPLKAAPDPLLLSLLEELSKVPSIEVHLVSGRDAKTLESWFGHLPIYLSAEHGYEHKSYHQNIWTLSKEVDLNWKECVTEILSKIVDEVPGSFLEFKKCAICWHYRLSDLDYGQWRAKELYTALIQELTNLPVEIMTGKKVIEVRALGISKANYVHSVLERIPDSSFILCIGDDKTDEEMYQALPENSVSIHVGSFHAASTYFLDSPTKVKELLREISQALSCEKELDLDE